MTHKAIAGCTNEVEASFVNKMEHVENNVLAVSFAHLHLFPLLNLFPQNDENHAQGVLCLIVDVSAGLA